MKIVYLLLTHKNEPQIRRLVARLRAGGDSFLLIHHDYTKGVSLSYPNSPDVHVIRDYVPIRWGDVSLLLATLRGIRWLGEERFDFDWLITLSGQDYPARPLSRVEASLRSTAHDAFVAHELIREDPALHERPWQTLCLYHYFYRSIHLFGREYRIKRRHPYKGVFNCYAGSNWLNLSCRAVEYLWSQKELNSNLVRFISVTIIQEEIIYKTVRLNGLGLEDAIV